MSRANERAALVSHLANTIANAVADRHRARFRGLDCHAIADALLDTVTVRVEHHDWKGEALTPHWIRYVTEWTIADG